MKYIFDIETNGLLDELTTIHCLVLRNVDTNEVTVFQKSDIGLGLKWLMEAELISGHNVIKFDIPAIQKLYPWFTVDKPKVLDTLVCTRLIWAAIKERDVDLMRKEILPRNLFGSHSLKAWGHRLQCFKGDYDGGWDTVSQEMIDYCVQDTEVTMTLYNKIVEKKYSPQAIELEHKIAWLMAKQERNGFTFDEQSAAKLYGKLSQRRADIERELKETFQPWEVQLPDFIPARDNQKKGYTKGVPVKRYKTVEFNPNSRDHIANRLMTLYDWDPQEFTEGGKPKVDETVISQLDYPPCKLIGEYLMLQKRIGQLAEGDQAWLKLVKDGRIHGSINTNGAVTGRATHAYPNISQVPGCSAPYGMECRSLFTVPEGWVLAAADASGLELRCLAHFMAKWDGGKYGEVLLSGDIHTMNQEAAGLPTRASAKTFIYGLCYGAGDAKIGSIIGKDAKAGKAIKNKFFAKIPALKKLRDAVSTASKRGYLVGLDGRHLYCRSEHSSLNTLLQGAGAALCKQWLILLEEELQAHKLSHGWDGDYCFCAWSHDEVQIACRNDEIAELVMKLATECVTKAGEHFNFRCPLAGEAKKGKHWGETH
jgi:DNA polymerase I-like protein with 3'-5' exonuclease and polymerase domains